MIDLLPPDPEDMELLHTRTYQVRAYRKSSTTMMLRGAVRDVKPAGLYVPEDPEPLVVRRAAIFATNVNTCHVWEENTEHTKKHTSGEELDGELPLWIEKRFAELGRDPHEWRNRMT